MPNFPRQIASDLLADKVSIWSTPKVFTHPSIKTFNNKYDSLEFEIKYKCVGKSRAKEVENQVILINENKVNVLQFTKWIRKWKCHYRWRWKLYKKGQDYSKNPKINQCHHYDSLKFELSFTCKNFSAFNHLNPSMLPNLVRGSVLHMSNHHISNITGSDHCLLNLYFEVISSAFISNPVMDNVCIWATPFSILLQFNWSFRKGSTSPNLCDV